jgi:O-acetylserine/cysteine efflux transporter
VQELDVDFIKSNCHTTKYSFAWSRDHRISRRGVEDRQMRTNRRSTLLALLTAGLLWGTTVPLTKVALTGVGPGWLTVLRFVVAAVPIAILARRGLRAALSPRTVAWGAAGFGAVIILQNAGIARTSVSHSALIVGATPVLVAALSLVTGRGRPGAWNLSGLLFSLAGIGVIAGSGGEGATVTGDLLVGASALLSAGFLVVQPGLLAGRDVAAVTAVQFAAGAAAALPAAFLIDGVSGPLPGPQALLAALTLAVAGTLIPFTLFAYGQARVAPSVAGVFVNLEPLVGFLLGVAVFGDSFAGLQVAGSLAVAGGIVLTSVPLLRVSRPAPPPAVRRPAVPHAELVAAASRPEQATFPAARTTSSRSTRSGGTDGWNTRWPAAHADAGAPRWSADAPQWWSRRWVSPRQRSRPARR